MPNKRPWKLWPQKFKDELNGGGGVAGVGAGLMTIAGFTILSGPLGWAVGGIGAFIFAGTVCYAGVKAVPNKFLDANSSVGSSFTINQLDSFYPPIEKLAIIGPQSAGKTTLKLNLAFQNTNKTRTQIVDAQIVAIPDHPPRFLAIIDGAGEKLHQQFEIAKHADYVCIVIDHNISDKETRLSVDRINENTDFLDRIRKMLADEKAPKKKWIEILVNKQDLWEKSTTAQQTKFEEFYESELKIWRQSNLADLVEMHPHSNTKSEDINRFMEVLKSSLANA